MKKALGIVMSLVLLASCVGKDEIKKALKDDPTILAEAIKANPAEVMEALQVAAQNAKEAMAKKREEEENKKLHEFIENPLKPEIRSDESVRGTKGGIITLVEYSDFQCPYCTRGFDNVVKPMLDKYKGKVQFVYKHLPLSFHSEARIAAAYYEAVRLQSEEKAFKFHDILFTQEGQQKLRNLKEKYLKKTAKDLGVNMTKLAKDVKSDAVEKRIAQDEAEARKFDIQGTPGFVINGVPVKGAYPLSHFEMILGLLKEKGKLDI
ncbi:DsbA family protein [Halobacteriovorax sp. RT-2-6]|uniref:DsbA family protein n=1 Tax=unclassified Halobacteriovorax TaxID=2639665 RepID=UPI00399BDBFF